MKLAAIIVVYQPDVRALINNILSLVDDVDQLLIYKNSEIEIDECHFSQYLHKIKYLGNGNNIGIAGALNEGVKWAFENSFTHLLTLDQDSFFLKSHLEKFKIKIENSSLYEVGVFCPNFEDRGSLSVKSEDSYVEVADAITSGSIYPLQVFEKCGLFEDKLFIDAVDYEFCYRMYKTKGLITVIFPEIILKHEVGYPTKIMFGLVTDNYSAFRTYYIVRNHIVMWRRHSDLFQYKKNLVKNHILCRIVKILIGEKDKFAKIKSIVVGIYDGLVFNKKNIF
jgi:rhamnosyltransferase